MILVDSSVWIDYLKKDNDSSTELLSFFLENNSVLMCDLVMMEVLRGISNDQHYAKVKALFLELEHVSVSTPENWIKSIDWYRAIRKNGYTIRSQVDIMLAMYCFENKVTLFHRDVDFEVIAQIYPFKHLNSDD